MKKLITFACFLSLCSQGLAQDSLRLHSKGYFRFEYENDLFTYTDRYYTQGVSVELVAPFVSKSPVSKLLFSINKQAIKFSGLKLKQDCFTPISILFDTINRLERPYSGVFYLSHFLTSLNEQKKRKLTTALDIGMIGPAAGCEQEQKTIHRIVNSDQPLGWRNQLKNDVVLNYSAVIEQSFVSLSFLEIIGSVEVRAGTLYNDAGAGLQLRFGKMNPYFKTCGLVNAKGKNKFQLFAYGKIKGKTIAYNSTLQGGVFTQSVYEINSNNIERLVVLSDIGIVTTYKNLCLEYARTFVTKEFKTGLEHSWGRCGIMVYF